MADQQTSKLPYSYLAHSKPHGIIFAVRGGQIVSFRTTGGPSTSRWTHPDQTKLSESDLSSAKRTSAETDDATERSSKRQKTEEPEVKKPEEEQQAPADGAAAATQAQTEPTAAAATAEAATEKKSKKKKEQAAVKPDRPIITLLSVTQDGKHVIAVSGHDKTLWVFEHDGHGKLTESSKRPMPKRPCGIALAQNDRTIISADKFGDVYAVPLIPSDTITSGPTMTLAVKHKRETPAATPQTVHSAGNLRALEAQKRHIAERQQQQALAGRASDAPDAPTFEHTLVLGHVSMLTDVVVARDGAREFIVTADRDEHVRVSRAPPQAYVIEGFCLAHKEFVSALAVDKSRPQVLVSGGGDAHVFVWDWKNSALMGSTDLLAVAKEAFGVSKIAVSKIVATDGQFFVICEGIAAVFQLTLEGTSLVSPTVIPLPGGPLGISIQDASNITVSADGAGLVQLVSSNGTWEAKTNNFEDAAVDSEAPDVTADECRKLLYTVESMRKKVAEFLAGQEGEAEAETEA
ncbi:hypothetical protein TD95_004783 [Thielaviopsis punctulata]|uniref:Uncharacterized protein n=1 Tax=Thielaviopsis punctulata TaxID=72032 RepID=A0A0F4ZK53_9PEZI|nr:hypothetical protein TD95_004783 [Thielaviopsis punctulata]